MAQQQHPPALPQAEAPGESHVAKQIRCPRDLAMGPGFTESSRDDRRTSEPCAHCWFKEPVLTRSSCEAQYV